MLYHDATGMLTIEFLDDKITINRTGSMPSTKYLMQESVIIEGILDELDLCAFDDKVAEDDRLLLTATPDAIDIARSSLSFG